MLHAHERQEICTKVSLENKGRDHLEDPCTDGRTQWFLQPVWKGVDWINLAQERDSYEHSMNFWVP